MAIKDQLYLLPEGRVGQIPDCENTHERSKVVVVVFFKLIVSERDKRLSNPDKRQSSQTVQNGQAQGVPPVKGTLQEKEGRNTVALCAHFSVTQL